MFKKADTYKGYIFYKFLFIIALAVAVAGTALLSITAGSANLSVGDVFAALAGQGGEQAKIVVWNIRMPRIITALVAGIGLAATGCAMQSILRNPLASASTLGISQGAAFGASFAIIALGAGIQGQESDAVMFINSYLIPICAFAGSITSTMVVVGLSRFVKISPEGMILTGVALSSLFAGATTLLQYFAADVKIAAVVFWTFGDLGRTGWKEIFLMTVATSVSIVYFLHNRWNFNALQNGDETAKGLGVNVDIMRIVGMVMSAMTASVIVSFVGIINFIGLISPHLVRQFIGGDYWFLLPASALAGALLLLLSDNLARLVVSPVILPIGAITSILGAPIFLYLLFRGVRK